VFTKTPAQNSGLLDILIKSTSSAEQRDEQDLNVLFSSTTVSIDSAIDSLTLPDVIGAGGGGGGPAGSAFVYSPTTYACYATLIYLCIILFTIFGLILKFLHLHILRKRYRKLCDEL
jgi:hypothetical protein